MSSELVLSAGETRGSIGVTGCGERSVCVNTRMCAWLVVTTVSVGVGTVQADTLTTGALKDNTLYQDDFGELSNGLGSFLFAGVNGRGEIRRGLIAFDVSMIPAGSTIKSVSLRLRMSRTQDGPEPVTLHRMLEDWGEGASNAPANEGAGTLAMPGDATWLHTFYDTALWTDTNSQPVPGGFFEPAASGTSVVDQIGFYMWSEAGMIADVQAWVNNPGSNFGWVIRGFEDGVTTAKRFDSRNNSVPANRPQLIVMFSPPMQGCPCDINNDDTVTSADFFDYLTAFFNMDLAADFDGSGSVDSADFFGFLTCFFEPPASCL